MRIFVVFGTIFLYGMERAVIETFDCLRPQVETVFHTSSYNRDTDNALMQELNSRHLTCTFFPDERGWPSTRHPRSLREAWSIGRMLVSSNWSVLKASWNCDLLYIPSNYWARHALLAAIATRLRRKRVVYHFHNIFTERYAFLDSLSYLVTDFVHNTQLGFEWTTRSNPRLLKKRHTILPCVIDPRDNVAPDPLALSEFEGKRNIVFIGQVSARKGIDLLVQAFRQIAPDHPDAVLHIIGSTLPGYDHEFQEMIGGADQIRFWGYRRDALHMLRKAQLYVHPSPPSRVQESFGRGLVEAMSLGVPAVCFASGAFSEIVVNGRSGWVCEEESADALEHALRILLSQESLRDKLGREALKRYEQEYCPAVVVPQWRRFIQALNHQDSAPTKALIAGAAE